MVTFVKPSFAYDFSVFEIVWSVKDVSMKKWGNSHEFL